MIRECFWFIVTTAEWNMRQTNGIRRSPGETIVKMSVVSIFGTKSGVI